MAASMIHSEVFPKSESKSNVLMGPLERVERTKVDDDKKRKMTNLAALRVGTTTPSAAREREWQQMDD
ncbi:hypothetical protein PRIPAC_70774 [Pristionchus pacificus]|uniref:Uncharacterized protein n=1 Tax=Pristionchus pacificus TaxID=54126 RepID=A0A2A6CRL8_PRIPA|nr:hypothetical protein PRIPAC_70774 [Pristionchus pacificus]|eukprot:PDM80864.1 hypothetical protein PRIPAC_35867 [Pristionchus pacificus]